MTTPHPDTEQTEETEQPAVPLVIEAVPLAGEALPLAGEALPLAGEAVPVTKVPHGHVHGPGYRTPAGVVRLAPQEAHLALAERTKVGRGRPTKCTPELLQQLAQLIQGGVSPHDACGMAGIHKANISRWQERGRQALAHHKDSRSIFAEFVRTLDGRGAIARGVLGAKLHKMGRDGNIAAIQTWMRYFGVRAFQPGSAPAPDDRQDAVVTIEFDGDQVFGGRELRTTDEDEPSDLPEESTSP